MEKWQPPKIGDKQENEETCYTVAIGNLPLRPNRKVKKFLKWVQDLDGFVGYYPLYPRGTLVIFRTENDAKRGRNLIRTYPGYQGGIGDNIGEVYIDKGYLNDEEGSKERVKADQGHRSADKDNGVGDRAPNGCCDENDAELQRG